MKKGIGKEIFMKNKKQKIITQNNMKKKYTNNINNKIQF